MAEDPRYAEVRERLRQRGYLQGPFERFVLRDAVGQRAPALLWTAAKAALLGAPLLGALLAGAALALNRPLLRGADAVLIWLYLSIAAWVLLFALDLVVAAVVATTARRDGPSGTGGGRRTALVVALLALGYLAFVWSTRDPGLGRFADVGFLLGALAVAAAVGRLARLVSLAAVVRRTGDVPVAGRRGIGGILLLTVAAAVAFAVLPRTPVVGAEAVPPTPFRPAADPVRTFLLGVDGLDGALIEALSGTPAIEPWIDAFATGAVHPVRRDGDGAPPAVWTTVMTGVEAREHGVLAVESERLPGVSTPLRSSGGPVTVRAALRFLLPTRTVPTSGAVRTRRTLWEIVGEVRPTAAVGWWASWPAERGSAGGYVVSDRLLAGLLAGSEPDRDTDPASLRVRLAAEFDGFRDEARASFDAAFGAVARAEIRERAWDAYVIDRHALAVVDRLLDDPDVVLGTAYLPGLDILRHRLLVDEGGGDGGAAGLVARGEVLARYVRWLGDEVGARVGTGGLRTVVVTDRGRAGEDGDEGLLFVAGPGVEPACIGPPLDTLTVVPALLRLLGFPESDELRPAPEAPCWTSAAADPVRIATYGRRALREAPRDPAVDADLLERLRSLGYVD